MKKKIIFTFLICFNIGIWVIAQSLSAEILSTDGNVSNTSTMSIEWTLGELMVSNSQTKKVLLTEGFHQPLLDVLEIPNFLNDAHKAVTVKVWPNPLDAILNIQVESTSDQNFFVECFTSLGKSVTLKKSIFPNEISKLSLDQNPTGLYFLRFSNSDQGLVKTIIINKL